MNYLIKKKIYSDVFKLNLQEQIDQQEYEIKSREMALRIGLPGGDMFLALFKLPSPLYEAYTARVFNWDNPLFLKELDQVFFAQPAIQHLEIQWKIWELCLHWLYKKRFDSKHKLPQKFAICRLFEPIGEILNSTLLLVEYIYLYGNKRHYTHHWEWFALITEDLQGFCFDIPDGKATKVKNLRSVAKALRDEKNPFPEEITPHLWKLIDEALNLQKSPTHRRNVFRLFNLRNSKKKQYGFTSAIAHWAGQLNVSPYLTTIESDETGITFNEKSGKGKAKINQKEIVKILEEKRRG
jgi:hypothetical protein